MYDCTIETQYDLYILGATFANNYKVHIKLKHNPKAKGTEQDNVQNAKCVRDGEQMSKQNT